MKKFRMARRRGDVVTEIIINAIIGAAMFYIAIAALSLILGR